MTDSYKVRGGIEDVSGTSTTSGQMKQAAKDIKDLGTVDDSFSRGQLYLLEDEVVFAQSVNESTVKNLIDNVFSKGPFNPLRTFGIYKPYEAPLDEADQYDGSWRLPYSDIEAISLLSKSTGYEIFLRPTGDPGYLYRIRNDQGTDPFGFRWLYSPNHDTAVQMAGELFDQAARYGEVVEFDAGDHFAVRTKQVDFSIGESQYADKDPVQRTSMGTEGSQSPTNASGTVDTAEQDGSQKETRSAETSTQAAPTLQNESSVSATTAATQTASAEGTTDDSAWVDVPDDSTSRVEITNQTDSEETAKVVFRVDGEETFSMNSSIAPGLSTEMNGVPEQPFEIGIATSDGVRESAEFDDQDEFDTIQVALTEAGIRFSPETGTSGSQTVDHSPTQEASETTTKAESQTATRSQSKSTTSAPEQRNESSISQSTTHTPSVSILPALGLLLGVAITVSLPFSGVFAPASTRSAAVVAGLPSVFSLAAGYLLIAEPTIAPETTPSMLAAIGIMGITIPATLMLDLLYVRRKTKWNPNRVLYPLGAVLIWPLTILLYLYRRRKATNQPLTKG